jgi:HNH endonuclease
VRPPHTRLAVIGKHHWSGKTPQGVGRCTWCGKTKKLTPDHVIPRSLAPAAVKHSDLNIVGACASCNGKRAAGSLKPLWWCLDGKRRRMVLEVKSIIFARRYFRDVPDDEVLAAAG